MAEAGKKDPRTVQLKSVRLSFADGLVEKKAAVKDAKERHSCNLIIITPEGAEKDPLLQAAAKHFEANKAAVISAMKAAGEQAFGNPDAYKVIAEDSPKRVAFRKGERFKNDEGQVYTGYANNWAISAAGGPGAGQRLCKIYNRNKRQITEKSEIAEVAYTGSLADVIVSFYGGDEGGRGMFCSIDAIRSHQEGQSIGGGGWTGSVDEFDDLPEGDAFSGTESSQSSGSPAPSGGDSDF